MGDRCDLEMTLRRGDLPRFGELMHTQPNVDWFDTCGESDSPEVVIVRLYEANYAIYEERLAAAKAGIPFFGSHGEGGEYGAYGFASLDGEMLEVPLSHAGNMFIAVDDDLKPLDDIEDLRAYVARLRAVKTLFGMGKETANGQVSVDQQAEPAETPAGLRAA
jgi:hypothetical protein